VAGGVRGLAFRVRWHRPHNRGVREIPVPGQKSPMYWTNLLLSLIYLMYCFKAQDGSPRFGQGIIAARGPSPGLEASPNFFASC
jgi:hypothetical protein